MKAKTKKILQVVVSRTEARRIERYAKGKQISVSGFLRRLANLVIAADLPNA